LSAGSGINPHELFSVSVSPEKAIEVLPKGAGYFYLAFGNSIYEVTGNKKEASVYYKKSIENRPYVQFFFLNQLFPFFSLFPLLKLVASFQKSFLHICCFLFPFLFFEAGYISRRPHANEPHKFRG